MIKLYDYIYRIMWYIVVNTCEYIYIHIQDVHYIMNKMKRTQLAAELSPKCGTKNYIYINPPCPRLIMFCRPPKMWSHQRVPSQGLAPCISASEKGASTPAMVLFGGFTSLGLAPCISASEKGASCLPNVRSCHQTDCNDFGAGRMHSCFPEPESHVKHISLATCVQLSCST